MPSMGTYLTFELLLKVPNSYAYLVQQSFLMSFPGLFFCFSSKSGSYSQSGILCFGLV